MAILVIGTHGLLGRQAVLHCKQRGISVLRASHEEPADFPIDLSQPVGRWATTLPDGITHAWICSGEGDPDACRSDPLRTRAFQVDHTIELLDGLMERGIRPIFSSSSQVFAGHRGHYRCSDETDPITEFGHQKKAVEDHLRAHSAPSLVLRFTQLYDARAGDTSFVVRMARDLANNRPVVAADDEVLCPTWVADVPRAVETLIRSNAQGIWNVAAPATYTRFTLALLLARRLNRVKLVGRCSLRDTSHADQHALDTSLDVSRLQAMGFRFTSLEELIPQILWEAMPHPEAELIGA